MEKKLFLTKYNDPGHGWVEIGMATLRYLGIANKITNYSYRKGPVAYLEEDCDQTELLRAAEKKGIEIEIQEVHTNYDSHIRNLLPYWCEGGVLA